MGQNLWALSMQDLSPLTTALIFDNDCLVVYDPNCV